MAEPPTNNINAYKIPRIPESENMPTELSCYELERMPTSPVYDAANETSAAASRSESVPTVSYYNLSFLDPHDFSPVTVIKSGARQS